MGRGRLRWLATAAVWLAVLVPDLRAQVIVRVQPPAPTVTITVPTASPTYDAGTATTIAVSGTASTLLGIQRCTWTNSLGGSGTAVGTTGWAIALVPLTVGANVVTIACTDGALQVGVDVVTITVSAALSTNPLAAARMPSGSATLPDSTLAGAGVIGGIPTTWPNCDNSACNALATGGVGAVTGATIQAALNGAQVGGVLCNSLATACVVRIRTVTASFAGGFDVPSFHIIRGNGANNTLLTMTSGDDSVNGPGCGYSYAGAIGLCGHPVGGDTVTATWSGTMSKGTSVITLSTRTGIVAGKTPIVMNQLDETDGYPNVGDIFICETGPPCSGGGGGASNLSGTGESGRAPAQISLVTACGGGTCVGAGTVTIDPPISMDNFRVAKSPHAFWENSPNQATQWAGVEDLSINYAGATGGFPTAIKIANASNVWVKGIRTVMSVDAANYAFILAKVVHATIQSSYFYRPTSQAQETYPDAWWGSGAILYQNNICHGVGCGTVTTIGPNSNSVIAYSFTPGNDGPGYINHGAGEVMNLLEGNIVKNVWEDINEGSKGFLFLFRNAIVGNRYQNGGGSLIQDGVQLEAHNRFSNLVGNVLGDASIWSVYQGTSPGGSCGNGTFIYQLGNGGCSGVSPASDARVAATMVRWFNWDDVTSTAPTVDGDQTGTRCVAGEVPTGITFLPNPLPGACTAPASLYLSAKPAWWPASIPWPGIGPDVTGGTITNLGGHAYLNAAANCYLNVLLGAANGSSGLLPFNAAACYGAGNY